MIEFLTDIAAHTTPAELIDSLLRVTQYEDYLIKNDKTDSAQDRIENLMELKDASTLVETVRAGVLAGRLRRLGMLHAVHRVAVLQVMDGVFATGFMSCVCWSGIDGAGSAGGHRGAGGVSDDGGAGPGGRGPGGDRHRRRRDEEAQRQAHDPPCQVPA